MSVLVGITQRVIIEPRRKERRDALDQAWGSLLLSSGLEGIPVPNLHPDPGDFAKRLGVQGLIFSGGNNLSQEMRTISGEPASGVPVMNDIASERDNTEIALLHTSIIQGWPVLGICRGMQLLNVFHGGGLSSIPDHVRKNHAIDVFDTCDRCPHGVLDKVVNSFHDYGITKTDLAPGMQIWATSRDGTIEAFVHAEFPHYGIMWHPERYAKPRTCDKKLFQSIFLENNVSYHVIDKELS